MATLAFGLVFSLDQFRWNNRVIILYDHTIGSKTIQDQLATFQGQESELTERKLIIIGSTQDGAYYLFKDNTFQSTPITSSKNLYHDGSAYTFNLIGLDGGVKHTSKAIVSTEELLVIIDGMPMRRSELRGRGK